MTRDIVALGAMITGGLALVLLAVALITSGELGQAALLIGGVLVLAAGAVAAQWDPEAVALARARRRAVRQARQQTADEQLRTGRTQLPRLPRDPG